ncbi:unnamed protein product [Heterobilharzia americana]|nr:unnamed protein product [Heterobilharzia americana]
MSHFKYILVATSYLYTYVFSALRIDEYNIILKTVAKLLRIQSKLSIIFIDAICQRENAVCSRLYKDKKGSCWPLKSRLLDE